ncbi:MAG TPA: type II toxin-antitoxin system VapC family toxin [Candidatus Binataceae bacterium]|nr:type II toxin-antitoxin system VapC family toxin [Candidatus Binataceae bacterium]
MILVDTSVWVDHLRRSNARLGELLNTGSVLVHPFVIGEIALGWLCQRRIILAALSDLPRVRVGTHDEVLGLIERESQFGRGIGFVDAHLLVAARLTPGTTLWTLDRRLHTVADQLGLATKPSRD